MPKGRRNDTGKGNGANLGFEEKLWQAADKLRGHMDAAEYKHGENIESPRSLAGPVCVQRTGREGQGEGAYQDIPGFCKSATTDEIAAHGYVLTPGRYVGAEGVEDDDEPFEEKMKRLTARLEEQFAESVRLEKVIRESLKRLGYGK